jgi:tetratricopeptide (TPR) repeat protein
LRNYSITNYQFTLPIMSPTPADTLKEEGLAHFQQGRYADALATFEAAAQAYEQAGQPLARAEMLNNMGVLYRVQRQPQAALKVLTEAAAVFAEGGDANRQAQALANMGDLHAAGKERQQAARCYSDAAELFAQTEDRERQSMVLRAFSLLSVRQLRWLEALAYMEQSLTVRPRLGLGERVFRGLIRFMMTLMGR